MLSLVYVSTCSEQFAASELMPLAERAAKANVELGVTGLLAWNSRHFMQLLEGEDSAVRKLMGRIERDERHSHVVYLRQEDREERECPDWGMQAITMPLAGAGSATRFTAGLPKGLAPDSRLLFTSFASALRERAA